MQTKSQLSLQKCIELASSSDFSKRQNALDTVLRYLLEEQFQNEPQKEYGVFFHSLYSECNGRHFRHQYASIYKIILSRASDDDSTEPNEIADMLVNNLSIIKNKLIDDSDTNAKSGLFKLIDHVNLEAQRLVRETAKDSHQTENLRQELRSTRAQLQSMLMNQIELKGSIAHQQRDYVTILSVFVAIIIAFGTGTGFAISLTSSVIPQGSVALICFAVSVVGLVLFNSLFVLFEFLYRVLRRGWDGTLAGPWNIMQKATFATVNVAIFVVVLIFGLLAYCNPMYESPNADKNTTGQHQTTIITTTPNGDATNSLNSEDSSKS